MGRAEGRSPTCLTVLPSFLPGLNFSNCSRQALEKALLGGMGSCLFERQPGLPSLATIFRNVTVEAGKQFSCAFLEVSPTPPRPTHPFPCPARRVSTWAVGLLCAGPGRRGAGQPSTRLSPSASCPTGLR